MRITRPCSPLRKRKFPSFFLRLARRILDPAGCLTRGKGSDNFADEESGEISSDMRKGYRRWLWLGIGAIIIALIFYNLSRSPEWANFRWTRLWTLIAGARPVPLLLALIGVFERTDDTQRTLLARMLRWFALARGKRDCASLGGSLRRERAVLQPSATGIKMRHRR